jgi:hypothetical protein
MWACVLLTDSGNDPVMFSGVNIVPVGDPIILLDAVSRTGARNFLIVAAPASAEFLHGAVTIVAGRRPDLSLSSLITEHSPLAVLSALTLARAATDEPAIGVELTRRILDHSWSGAWVGSVAKLNRPNPRLGQHLRSLLPGGGFLVRQSPDPAVLSAARPDDVPSAGCERVLLVQDDGVPAPVTQRLSEVGGVTAVRQVAVPGEWLSIYGTDRTGQLALVPAEPRSLIGPVTHRCPACLLALISTVCPFCRVVAVEVQPIGRRAVGYPDPSTAADPAPPPVAGHPGSPVAGHPAPSAAAYPADPAAAVPEPAVGYNGTRLLTHPAQPGGTA